MTELIESVAIEEGALDKHSEEDCPFCKSGEPAVEENVLDPSLDEDISQQIGLVEVETYTLNNCAAQLGTALGGKDSLPPHREVAWEDKVLEIAYAAHHLIPGNGSLKPSALLKCGKYLLGPKQLEGNIGYNVNCKENGVWLPGNYAYSQKETGTEWGTKGKTFKEFHKVDPGDYVGAVIEHTTLQFHDAHRAYNTFVKLQLNKIKDKLDQGIDQPWCPEGAEMAKNKEGPKRPLYQLVGRTRTHLESHAKEADISSVGLEHEHLHF